MLEAGQTAGIATRRKNGFEYPFDGLQMVTWAMYPLILTHYFAFLYFLLWNLVAKIVLTVCYGLLAIALGVSVYLTCSTDPADDALCMTKALQGQGAAGADEIYCYFCELNVHSSSKHCRFCDKCVFVFDHHCKWLNTCVGGKNYAYFLAVVLSALLLTATNLSLSIALLAYSFAFPRSFHHRVAAQLRALLGSSFSAVAVQAILVVSVALFLALVLMILQLCSFHIMLIYRRMTTYDFIVSEQKRLREKEAQRLQRQVERQQSLRQQDQELANISASIAKANALVDSSSSSSQGGSASSGGGGEETEGQGRGLGGRGTGSRSQTHPQSLHSDLQQGLYNVNYNSGSYAAQEEAVASRERNNIHGGERKREEEEGEEESGGGMVRIEDGHSAHQL